MISELKRQFYKLLIVCVIVAISAFAIFIVTTILTLIDFLNTGEKIYLPIGFGIFFLVINILMAKALLPFLKDLRAVKTNSFLELNGTVVRFRKVVQGGEPETVNYYPIIKDELGKEIELKADGTKINGKYTFLYLKNTRLAIVKKD